jgi:hypothetical protein
LIGGLPESIEQLAKEPKAESTAESATMVEHLGEILETGDYGLRKKLLKKYPATILMLQLQSSIGAAALEEVQGWDGGGRREAGEGRQAAGRGRLGEKSEQNILKAVEVFKRPPGVFTSTSLKLRQMPFARH